MSASRRRAVLALSVACGVLAAVGAQQRLAASAESRGASVGVLVANSTLRRGETLDAPALAGRVAMRQMPAQLLPHGAVRAPDELLGRTPAVEIPAGAVLSSAFFQSLEGGVGALRRGERAVSIVARVGSDSVEAGVRVDVIASSNTRGGSAALLVEGAEVLESTADVVGDSPDAEGDALGGATQVQLRVSLRQAALLLAASNESTRLTLLLRPETDKTPVGSISVAVDRLFGG